MKLSRFMISVLLVAALGCAPSETPPPEPAAPASPASGSFDIEVEGRTIHYEVHGSGPVVMVLTNSWGLSLQGLHNLFGPLEERLTMVYFDPRGMGLSSPIAEDADMGLAAVRADFHAVRQHLGLEQVNVIGWSNGAMNLITLAAEQPGTVNSAIFVHGTPRFGPEDMVAFAEREPELTRLYMAFLQEMADDTLSGEDKNARMRKTWLEDYFPAICADPEATGPAIGEVFADAEFSWPHAEYANQESPVFDARDQLGSITARCLVISGAHDSIPVDRVREISDGIADATFVVFEKSGHFSPIEEPERFADTVFGFLNIGSSTSN